MKFSIDELQAAGVPDTLIVRLVREKSADKSEQWRKQKQKQRSCPPELADTKKAAYIEEVEFKKERKKKANRPKVALPENWTPSGGVPPEKQFEFQRFKNSAIAHDRHYANWDAAWRNWLSSPFQHRGNGHAHEPGGPR